MPSGSPAIAVVGCGAIAESFHLPALARHPEIVKHAVLVDPEIDRARALADRFGVEATAGDYHDVLDRIDGAIVAVPPRLHHPVAAACLGAGVHTLCEKPLCEDIAAARELVELSDRSGVSLAVNQTRRLFPAFQQVREILAAGGIGRIQRLSYILGEPFDWPAATDSYFGARGSGKGVLLDTGAHIVDLVTWWLGGRPQLVDYRDDSQGGTEAVAHVRLEHEGCHVEIQLSWLSKLANTYRVEGENGALEGEVYEWGSFTQRDSAGRATRVKTRVRPKGFEDFANALINNFIAVVRDGASPLVPGSEVLPSIEIIDACYSRRQGFDLPWLAPPEVLRG